MSASFSLYLSFAVLFRRKKFASNIYSLHYIKSYSNYIVLSSLWGTSNECLYKQWKMFSMMSFVFQFLSDICLKARTPWGRLGHQQHRNWVGEKWGQMRQPQFFTRQLFPFHIFDIYWLIDSFIYNSSIYSIDLSSAASNWVCENGANEAATICSNWKNLLFYIDSLSVSLKLWFNFELGY